MKEKKKRMKRRGMVPRIQVEEEEGGGEKERGRQEMGCEYASE